jgi:hypothetical protein
VGCVLATPRRIRLVPTIWAIVGNAVTNTVVIPSRSSSFASVAPQRVPVPQVPVKITAATSAARSSAAISWPNFTAVATGVSTPEVV